MVFAMFALAFADNWEVVNGSKVQTTIGYSLKGFQYICDWIESENGSIALHIRSAKKFDIERFKTSCIIVGNYVFAADAHTGWYENSIYLRFTQKKLQELLHGGQYDVIVKVAGYEFTTVVNAEIGEFKL